MSAGRTSSSLRNGLRPDVGELVDRLIVEAKGKRGHARERHYRVAQQRIDATCGWRSTGGRFDQTQYDMAIAAYLAGRDGTVK